MKLTMDFSNIEANIIDSLDKAVALICVLLTIIDGFVAIVLMVILSSETVEWSSVAPIIAISLVLAIAITVIAVSVIWILKEIANRLKILMEEEKHR